MKKLLTTLAAFLVVLIATPETAEANSRFGIGSSHTFISGHSSCGCPIYTKRVVRGFNSYRQPLYNYYRQPFKCGGHSNFRSGYTSPHFSKSKVIYSNFGQRSSKLSNFGHRGFSNRSFSKRGV